MRVEAIDADNGELNTMAALPMPAGEEGKMLSEALNVVKIQTQQMKRFLVRAVTNPDE